ncbi:MAG: hypothetical protein JXB47_15095 [Anaerolineae bacterium]|nr:hypothetical protein [Anaerolineae bacterium]
MKRLTRIALLVVLVLTLVVPTAALAQDDCYGLSEADCKLFTDMGPKDAKSFAMSFTFDLATTGDEPTTITSSGEGSFSVVEGAEDPMKSFSIAMTVNSDDGKESASFEFRIIDGVFYMTDPKTGEWKFKALDALMKAANMPIDPSSMFTGEGAAAGAMGGFTESMGPLADLVKSYYSVVRGADGAVGDITVAMFDAKFDIAGLVKDPGLTEGFTGLLKSNPQILSSMGMTTGAEMTEEELEGAAQGMSGFLIGMVSMILQNANLTYSVKIAPDTANFHGFTLHFDMTVDPSMMGMGGGDEEKPKPVEVNLNLDVNLWDYGATFEHVVPEGATELPDEMLGAGVGM